MKNTLIAAVASAALIFTQLSMADADRTGRKIQEALALEIRSDADRARDGNRQPAQALQFIGLRDDMHVFEFGTGSGWYTKILGPVLRDQGELTTAYPAQWLAELDDLMAEPEMTAVRRVNVEMRWDGDVRAYDFNGIDFDAKNLDLFLSIREYHNLYGAQRAEFNSAVFAALKPGGRYVVIDHTRRHMESDSPENWRREDPVVVLQEVLAAGFEIEKTSDMFYRADDTLEYEVGRKTVSGNTDRFFFVFMKPK